MSVELEIPPSWENSSGHHTSIPDSCWFQIQAYSPSHSLQVSEGANAWETKNQMHSVCKLRLGLSPSF
jgi:hypothetical protein